MTKRTTARLEAATAASRAVAIMAGNDISPEAQGDGSNGTLILKGFLWWAGHDVKRAPAKP